MAISESAYWSLAATIDEARQAAEPPRGFRAPSLVQGIRFERVGFRYDARDVLGEIDMEIDAGLLTVLTGPSGSGKTTLIDLVAGLLHPDSGRLLVDGVDLQEIDHRRWRRMIGYVPQDPLLINDSVIRNLTLGDPALGPADAERALKMADAWDFIQALPEGMETLLGERGGRLSGGQRQRLAIARALIHRPSLLILDEATSNLDHESEAAVIATIRQLKGQLTLLAVTHDDALVQAADVVIRLQEGRVQAC
jgi:ATP-binding cassette subfamily C protein